KQGPSARIVRTSNAWVSSSLAGFVQPLVANTTGEVLFRHQFRALGWCERRQDDAGREPTAARIATPRMTDLAVVDQLGGLRREQAVAAVWAEGKRAASWPGGNTHYAVVKSHDVLLHLRGFVDLRSHG